MRILIFLTIIICTKTHKNILTKPDPKHMTKALYVSVLKI